LNFAIEESACSRLRKANRIVADRGNTIVKASSTKSMFPKNPV